MRWLDRLLLLCVTLVVVANLLPLGARLSWMIDLTTHFRRAVSRCHRRRARVVGVAPQVGRRGTARRGRGR